MPNVPPGMKSILTHHRQLAAQQHEATISRHYESLLIFQNRPESSSGSDSTNNTHAAASLVRLSQLLQMLQSSLDGKHKEDAVESLEEPTDSHLEDVDSDEDEREDWAVERETEISRLEKENAELRHLLGIDAESVQNQGWKDEELEEHRPVIQMLRASMAHANLHDAWGQRNSPQLAPFNAGPVPGNAIAAPQQQTIPLQLAVDFQPGMRAAGALRRPSMFGRGASPFWDRSTPQERPWLQGHGGLDLAS